MSTQDARYAIQVALQATRDMRVPIATIEERAAIIREMAANVQQEIGGMAQSTDHMAAYAGELVAAGAKAHAAANNLVNHLTEMHRRLGLV